MNDELKIVQRPHKFRCKDFPRACDPKNTHTLSRFCRRISTPHFFTVNFFPSVARFANDIV